MLSSISVHSFRLRTRLSSCRSINRTTSVRHLPRVSRTGDGRESTLAKADSDLVDFWKQRLAATGQQNVIQDNTRTVSFTEQLMKDDPTYNLKKFQQELKKPRTMRHVFFVLAGTFIVFNVAASFTEVDTEHWRDAMKGTKVWGFGGVSSEDIRRVRQFDLGKNLQNNVKRLQDATAQLPKVISYPFVWTYAQVAQAYLNSTEGARMCWHIGAINGLVWVLWQIPRLHPVMAARFMHHPLSGRASTLLTSMFSHQSFIHLAFNTIAMTSFGSAASVFLQQSQSKNKEGIQESSSKWHMLAVFVSAGLFSGLVSHVVAARILFPRLVTKLSTATPIATTTASGTVSAAAATAVKAPADILPSLGASGGVYALVTMTALAFQDAHVSLMFLPIPIPITVGVGGMVALDVLGIIRGWRMFDHWAHLGGAAFGALYWKYGTQYWDMLRADYHEEGV